MNERMKYSICPLYAVYWGKDRSKELTVMDEEAETKAIQEWLRMVDKPLERKKRDKKDAEPKDEWSHADK